jgi:hypothetical protein
MASRFSGYMPRMNYRSLGERSYSGTQILSGIIGLLTAAGLIAGGIIIITQNDKIKDPSKITDKKGSDFNLLMASIFIIVGSLLVLFGLFKMFTKSE